MGDGWALVGDAAAFLDPYYSPGLDHCAFSSAATAEIVAMVILVVGVASVSSLMVVAGSSNTVANHSTAAAAVATQTMELLKAERYDALVTGATSTPTAAPPGSAA
jgi:hypothetical protein